MCTYDTRCGQELPPKGMGTSSKAGKGKRRDGKKKGEIPEHTLALRQRLRDALSLGIKFSDDKRRKWLCQNVGIMGHAVRAMSAFVGCISSDLLQHPLIKDTVSDMLVALEGILQSENETVLVPATNVTEKLFRSLGSSICQYHSSGIILPLSNLLSFHQSTIVIASVVALKCILKNVGSLTADDGIWNDMTKKGAIENTIRILLDCIAGHLPTDYFIEIASLLRAILWRWPPSRYPVWNNTELMSGLVTFCANSDPSAVVSILQLYSSLALCGDVAIMLLKSADSFVSEMLLYMHSSRPINVRIEALKFCHHLTRSEEGCNMLTTLCCEPLVQGIINAMGDWRSLHSRKVPPDQMPLVTTACRTALITRWVGAHHASFWKLGIDNLLLDLLLGNCKGNYRLKDPDELRAAVYDNITDMRNYIWDILGWLAMHCEESFHSEEKMNCLDTLIHCACLVAVDLMLMRSPSQYHSIRRSFCTSEAEPVSRAVVMMGLILERQGVETILSIIDSKLGRRMAGALNENELANLRLILSNGKSLGVHDVILMVRCPALLPSDNACLKHESSTDITSQKGISLQQSARSRNVIHLSNHVDADALIKLLEYVYTGYCQVDDFIAKPLLILARRCNVKSLYYMLKQRQPRCGAPIPRCDFTQLLALVERPFTYSQIIKVPICWEALVKLVAWFYSGELPKLQFHCAWNNMDSEQQFKELMVYVELSWLAEFWCLDDVHQESLEVITSCFSTNQKFPLKIIESALDLGQQKIVESAVGNLAPRYPRMRDAGDYEGINEEVVEMLQSAYVHYFQESHQMSN
ncbi:hypothetical protein Taro_026057 [Colocasia esculenta]|uniref:At1g04390 ARM repeat domain-containing protein n=1 Tax=Colocasia esculenta TaxID=4460 RepID=A0A843VE25_COLES|nr:hypothetical protein [Colocasia esculenta]